MKHTLNRIGFALILTLANASIVQADYGSEQPGVVWFSSDTSSLLNRSSIELATNHVSRGIRFAHQALAEKLNLRDQLIAYHNLCIGYLASDRPEYASRFCVRAHELAQEPYKVVKIRGAFRLEALDVDRKNMNNQAQTTLTPEQLIVRNIQQQKSQIFPTLSMK